MGTEGHTVTHYGFHSEMFVASFWLLLLLCVFYLEGMARAKCRYEGMGR